MNPDDFNTTFQQTAMGQLPLPPHDARFMAFELMQRDQGKARVWAFLSILFWLIGVVGMIVLVVGLYQFVLYIRISYYDLDTTVAGQVAMRSSTQPYNFRNPDGPTRRLMEMLDGTTFIHHALPYIGASMIALLLGAIFTVMLVFSSRRATLSRINLSLIQISEEIKQMRQQTRPPQS